MFINDHMVDAFESYIDHGGDHEYKLNYRGYGSEPTRYSNDDKKKWSKEFVSLGWNYPPLRISDKLTVRACEITVKLRVKHLTEKAMLFEPVVFFEHCGKHYSFISSSSVWLPKSVLDITYRKTKRFVIYHKRLEFQSAIEKEIDDYVLNKSK
jgi:hypothetical protein